MSLSPLQWSPDFSVGVDIIDEQHRQLFSIFNDLIDADFREENREWMRGKLEELMEYTRYHFQFEEELIRKFHPIDYPSHKSEHETFRRQIAKLYDRWLKGSSVVGDEAIAYLTEWISNHILEMDRKYGPFL